ncbi:unnamed protein product [Choristocarpus tenellus]
MSILAGESFISCARTGERYKHEFLSGRRIRAVISDLDGTLLNSGKEVSKRTLEVIQKARTQGVMFIPASGRNWNGIFNVLGELGVELRQNGTPVVCMNGLAVYGPGEGDHGGIIHERVLGADLASRVVDFWRSHPLAAAAGVSLVGSCGREVVCEKLDERTERYPDLKEPLPVEVGPLDVAVQEGMKLNRLFFWGSSREEVDAFRSDLAAFLDGYPSELTRGIPEMLEVLPPGSSKGTGVEALLLHLGISPEEVVALGDEENDLDMLRMVGYGVCMGQASTLVREASRFVAPTNDMDGVAVAIETFCGL